MAESISRMARTSVPGIYKLPSGLFLVRIRMRFGSASQSFTTMSSAKRWQRVHRHVGLGGWHLGYSYQGARSCRKTESASADQPGRYPVSQAIERFTQSGDCKVKPSILRFHQSGHG